MRKYLGILGLVLVAVIWGGGFVASDIALGSFTPFQIMVIRFLIASIFMASMGIRSLKDIKFAEVRAGFLMGLALFMGFALQIVALQHTTPSKNAFLTATNVVMVPFIAFVIYKKKVSKKGLLGAVLAIVGVGVLSLNGSVQMGFGDLLTLGCAVGFALQIFLTGEFVSKYRPAVLNFVQMGTAFGLSVIFLVASGDLQMQGSKSGWLSVLYLGIVSTAITYLLQTTCQKYVDETKAAIILSLESVFGTLFSILILNEMVTKRMVLGCILILGAVVISNLSETPAKET